MEIFQMIFFLGIVCIKEFHGIRLNLIHINDFQGHFLPVNSLGKDCSSEEIELLNCFGGFARLKCKINELQRNFENPIFLNVGDFAQDSIWFAIYGWPVIGHFFNMLNQTAMAFGSHEFDFGPEGVMSLLEVMNAPITCSNLDASKFPEIEKKVSKSQTILVEGHRVGLIGYLTPASKTASNPGLLDFFDDVQSVKTEAIRLHEEEKVSIIIAFGQSGFLVDKTIAELPYVDIVVGGRSHTFLYTGTAPSTDEAVDKYPTKITKRDGTVALVVQAGSFGKYLGMLHVTFDDEGKVVSWGGNPILLDNTVKEDPDVLKEIDEWRLKAKAFVSQEVGQTRVFMDGRISVCRRRECNIGNIITDAYVFLGLRNVDPNEDHWNYAAIAFTNSGGIRDSIDERLSHGVISREAVYRILPFKNKIYFAQITGETLKATLEFAVSELADPTILVLSGRFLQMSGVKMTVDLCGSPTGSRVKDVMVKCNNCKVPKYHPLENSSLYRIVIPDYLVSSQAFSVIANNLLNPEPTGCADSDALIEYLKARGPIITGTERRITILGDEGC